MILFCGCWPVALMGSTYCLDLLSTGIASMCLHLHLTPPHPKPFSFCWSSNIGPPTDPASALSNSQPAYWVHAESGARVRRVQVQQGWVWQHHRHSQPDLERVGMGTGSREQFGAGQKNHHLSGTTSIFYVSMSRPFSLAEDVRQGARRKRHKSQSQGYIHEFPRETDSTEREGPGFDTGMGSHRDRLRATIAGQKAGMWLSVFKD